MRWQRLWSGRAGDAAFAAEMGNSWRNFWHRAARLSPLPPCPSVWWSETQTKQAHHYRCESLLSLCSSSSSLSRSLNSECTCLSCTGQRFDWKPGTRGSTRHARTPAGAPRESMTSRGDTSSLTFRDKPVTLTTTVLGSTSLRTASVKTTRRTAAQFSYLNFILFFILK